VPIAALISSLAVPVVIVMTPCIGRGRMVDAPRPEVARPAAAMQALVEAQAVLRRAQETPA
jgi:hypothetical protein